jgi:hypothetical protein
LRLLEDGKTNVKEEDHDEEKGRNSIQRKEKPCEWKKLQPRSPTRTSASALINSSPSAMKDYEDEDQVVIKEKDHSTAMKMERAFFSKKIFVSETHCAAGCKIGDFFGEWGYLFQGLQ